MTAPSLRLTVNPNPRLKCTKFGHKPSSLRSPTLTYRVFELPALVQVCYFSCLFYHHQKLKSSFGSCFAPKKPVLGCCFFFFPFSFFLFQFSLIWLIMSAKKPTIAIEVQKTYYSAICSFYGTARILDHARILEPSTQAPSSLAQPCRMRISAHPRQAQTDTTELGGKEVSLILQMLFVLSLFEVTWNDYVQAGVTWFLSIWCWEVKMLSRSYLTMFYHWNLGLLDFNGSLDVVESDSLIWTLEQWVKTHSIHSVHRIS